LGFWDLGILGFWDFGILGFWDSGDFGIWGFWDSGILGRHFVGVILTLFFSYDPSGFGLFRHADIIQFADMDIRDHKTY
jgi:hypothetical protein